MPRKRTLPPLTCEYCGVLFYVSPSWLKAGPVRFHSHACYAAATFGTDESRLRAKTDHDGPEMRPGLGRCWEFTGARVRHGYGKLSARGKLSYRAHRLAWELANGPIPEGLEVCHKCDNPGCIRPDHLFLDTQSGNARDMWGKGRGQNPPRNEIRGEAHGGAQVTGEIVVEIRRRYAAGGVFQRELAAEYGLSQSQISRIIHRKEWQHL